MPSRRRFAVGFLPRHGERGSLHDSNLAAFGYWMKADAGLFENEWLANQIRRTLEKTKGVVEWEHGMMESLRSLASVSPRAALESSRLHLLVGRVADPADRRWVYVDDDLVEIFKILYGDPVTKEPTRKLINDLLPLGNGAVLAIERGPARVRPLPRSDSRYVACRDRRGRQGQSLTLTPNFCNSDFFEGDSSMACGLHLP